MCSLYIICILLIISFRGYRNRMLTWNGLIHYKAWTLILHKFKSSGCFGDGSSLWQWFWLEVRLHALWLVNHSTKTIHHHRYLLVQRQQWKYPKTEIRSKLRKKKKKQKQLRRGHSSDVLTVNFEHILHIVLVFPLWCSYLWEN